MPFDNDFYQLVKVIKFKIAGKGLQNEVHWDLNLCKLSKESVWKILKNSIISTCKKACENIKKVINKKGINGIKRNDFSY